MRWFQRRVEGNRSFVGDIPSVLEMRSARLYALSQPAVDGDDQPLISSSVS